MDEKEKRKAALLGAAAALALAAAGIVGYRTLRGRQTLPPVSVVSAADLVRLEKENPAALTDDQKRLLASITPEQKAKLANQPGFSIERARTLMHPQGPPAARH